MVLEKKAPPQGGALRDSPLASGVVVGSITALAATPVDEVRALVLGLCETMPPEAFKAFLQRLASGLGPNVHKVLLTRYAAGTFAGSWGGSTVKSVTPRWAAKQVLLGWLGRFDAVDLRKLVAQQFAVLPDETIEGILPLALAWASLLNPTTTSQELTPAPHTQQRSAVQGAAHSGAAAYAATASSAAAPAAPSTDARLPYATTGNNSATEEGRKKKRVSVKKLWRSRGTAALAELSNWRSVFKLQPAANGTLGAPPSAPVLLSPSLSPSAPTVAAVRDALLKMDDEAADALLRRLQVNLVGAVGARKENEDNDEDNDDNDDDEEVQAAMDAVFALPLPAQTLVAELPRWAKHRILEREGLSVTQSFVPSAALDALILLNTPVLRPPVLKGLARNAFEARALVASAVATTVLTAQQDHLVDTAQMEGGSSGGGSSGGGGRLSVPLGLSMGQVLEKLPPSFVSEQLAELVESVPDTVLFSEVSSLVAALPSSTLTELADRIAEALPASALRAIVNGIVEPSLGNQRIGNQSAAAIPPDTASLASEIATHCEEGFLRRTVSDNLASIPPKALKERLQRYIENQGSQALHARIIKLLRDYRDRTAHFRSFADMRAAQTGQNSDRDSGDNGANEETYAPEDADRRGVASRGLVPMVQPDVAPSKRGLLASARSAMGRVTNRRKAKILRNVVVKIPPDVLATKVFETIAKLPPESFASLAQDLSVAAWQLFTKRVMTTKKGYAVVTSATTAAGVTTGAVISSTKSLTYTTGLTGKALVASKAAAAAASAPAAAGSVGALGAAGAMGAYAKGVGVVAIAAGATLATQSSSDVHTPFGSVGAGTVAASTLLAFVLGSAALAKFTQESGGAKVLFQSFAQWWNQDSQASKRLLLALAHTSPACRNLIYEPALASLRSSKAQQEA